MKYKHLHTEKKTISIDVSDYAETKTCCIFGIEAYQSNVCYYVEKYIKETWLFILWNCSNFNRELKKMLFLSLRRP